MAEYDFSKEADLTNEQLAGELAKRTPLTAAEIERLLPTKADKKRFEELITIINSATAENKKVAELSKNIEALGGVVLKILGRFIKPV